MTRLETRASMRNKLAEREAVEFILSATTRLFYTMFLCAVLVGGALLIKEWVG